MEHHITLPIIDTDVEKIKKGDIVYISGIISTGRDQVHKRIIEFARGNKKLPANFAKLRGSAIYHMGPIVRKIGEEYEIVSGGPTTSARMNPFQTEVNEIIGNKIVIGKGGMSGVKWDNPTCVYLQFPGGAGAIVSKFVQKVVAVEWQELGPEAAWFLDVKDFGPLVYFPRFNTPIN